MQLLITAFPPFRDPCPAKRPLLVWTQPLLMHRSAKCIRDTYIPLISLSHNNIDTEMLMVAWLYMYLHLLVVNAIVVEVYPGSVVGFAGGHAALESESYQHFHGYDNCYFRA